MNLKVTSQTIAIAGHQITIDLPSDPEEMLEHALQGEAAGSSDWDPYWGLLWAASPATAELLLNQQWPVNLNALEIGCGVGLTGIAGLLAGMKVTFADHSSDAVRMAQANAAQNGFPNAAGLVFDWQQPPNQQFDFIFGSDILYDPAGHEPLLQTLSTMLSQNGQVWIGDAGRTNAPAFMEKAIRAGWQVELRDAKGQPVQNPPHLQFRLMMMTGPARASLNGHPSQ